MTMFNPLVGADAVRPMARDTDSIELEVYFSAMQQQEARNRQDSATLREDRAMERLHAAQQRDAQADAALWQQVRPLLPQPLVDQVTAAYGELRKAQNAEGEAWVQVELSNEREPIGPPDLRRKWRFDHREYVEAYQDASQVVKQAQARYKELAGELHQHFLAIVREQRTLAEQRAQLARLKAEELRRQGQDLERAADDATQATNRLADRLEQDGMAVIEGVIQ